ncbi:RNA-protein complex protein Nop10 [Candidatus Bathyarchaeota archaeon]|nr:RNA-protein complex protein Nop10 [Candidatus Bathyarchaeota archaeon]RLG99334.1 MAG: RNA-protein complex protein Nop10 [Candidatus Bathyarchaeota archaeon]HDO72111.1 RNA-protein complex protein Nop10 [Candidatus Bathyarchaeota archaeon]HEX69119.1 RNA-protein complex protein Nop10 [Candidatus Bathyarchaeota archaeon]
MGWLLRKCVKCGKYTLNKEKCPYCGGNVKIPHPAKFSPDDKYVKYKRMLLREAEEDEKNNN